MQELSPAVYGLLARFHSYIGREGIISEAPDYMFMDWGELYGRGFHHPPASWGEGYMTAFYFKGLLDGIQIAGYLGDTTRSMAFTAEAETLKAAFSGTLYDAKTGLFKNGIYGISFVKPFDWLPADTAITYSLPYANTLAVLYDLVPSPDKAEAILQHVLIQKEINISPYFMYFVLEAIAHADRFNEYGFDQLHRWKDLSQSPVGLREGWTAGDYSHAWGGSPAYELSSKVLGVYPSKPGFATVTIYPHPGRLGYASGNVATPRGPVKVSWQRSETAFAIKTTNAEGMPVVFILPLYKNGEVIVNGKKLMSGGKIRSRGDVKGKIVGENEKQIEIRGQGGMYFIELR